MITIALFDLLAENIEQRKVVMRLTEEVCNLKSEMEKMMADQASELLQLSNAHETKGMSCKYIFLKSNSKCFFMRSIEDIFLHLIHSQSSLLFLNACS